VTESQEIYQDRNAVSSSALRSSAQAYCNLPNRSTSTRILSRFLCYLDRPVEPKATTWSTLWWATVGHQLALRTVGSLKQTGTKNDKTGSTHIQKKCYSRVVSARNCPGYSLRKSVYRAVRYTASWSADVEDTREQTSPRDTYTYDNLTSEGSCWTTSSLPLVHLLLVFSITTDLARHSNQTRHLTKISRGTRTFTKVPRSNCKVVV
jgi:hypothetical protein